MARQQAGLRQKSVAKLLGHKSTSIISEYENGRLLPSLPMALRLSAIYGCNIRDLYPELNAAILAELQAIKERRSLNVAFK